MKSFLLLVFCGALLADEGMWTFDNPPTKLIQQKYNFTLTREWLDHVRLSSVRLNDGGSGSFVSPNGLLLTNHHVARGQLQKNSTPEHDFIKNGFYARTPDEEMKSPDLEVNVLVSMEDVTRQVQESLKGAKNSEEEFAARKKVIAGIERESQQKTGLRSDVVTLYQGGEYWLYRYQKYTDVRLVFAPEDQAAFFGGDPDNFTYPRYDLDMAIFRVYENGQPIESANYLKWNAKGSADGDLVFVSGHPGSTQRLDTVAQLETERDVVLPTELKLLRHRIEVLRKFAASSPEHARQADSQIFGLENSVKAIDGEYKGLQDKNVMDTKRTDEQKFRAVVLTNPDWRAKYGNAWDEIAAEDHAEGDEGIEGAAMTPMMRSLEQLLHGASLRTVGVGATVRRPQQASSVGATDWPTDPPTVVPTGVGRGISRPYGRRCRPPAVPAGEEAWARPVCPARAHSLPGVRRSVHCDQIRGVLVTPPRRSLSCWPAACGGGSAQKRAIERRYQRLAAAAGQASAAAPAAAPAKRPPRPRVGEPGAAVTGVLPLPRSPSAAPAQGRRPRPPRPRTAAASPTKATLHRLTGSPFRPGRARSGRARSAQSRSARSRLAGAGATAAASDAGVTATSIKLGHIGIYSGPVGSFGENLSYACRAGLQAVNDAGGVNGRKYDVLVRDDGWDATKGSNAVRDLVERQKVFALACSQSVPTNDAITPYMDQQKTPNVGSDGWGRRSTPEPGASRSARPGSTKPRTWPTTRRSSRAPSGSASSTGTTPPARPTSTPTRRSSSRTVEPSSCRRRPTSTTRAHRPSSPRPGPTTSTPSPPWSTRASSPGWCGRRRRRDSSPRTPNPAGSALYFQATPGLTGPSAEGTITAIDWLPDDPQGPASSSPGYREYKQTMEHYYPQIGPLNWTKAGFIGAKVLTDGLKRLGLNVTRQGLKDDLDRVSDYDTGIGARIGWRPGQHRSNKTTYLAQLKLDNGKLVWKYLAGPIVR